MTIECENPQLTKLSPGAFLHVVGATLGDLFNGEINIREVVPRLRERIGLQLLFL